METYLSRKKDFQEALRRIHKHLNPGGIFVVGVLPTRKNYVEIKLSQDLFILNCVFSPETSLQLPTRLEKAKNCL